jgi:tetratricopeptide (TPR) repeat protein
LLNFSSAMSPAPDFLAIRDLTPPTLVVLRTLVLVIAVWLASESARAQSSAVDWRRFVRSWVEAVHTHTPGAADEAASLLASWSRADLDHVRSYIEALADVVASHERRSPAGSIRIRLNAKDARALKALAETALVNTSPNEFLQRAAIVHTDAVIAVSGDAGRGPAPVPPGGRAPLPLRPSTAQVIARGPDGQFEGLQFDSAHWRLARSLLDRVDPSPSENPHVRLWYRTIAAYFAREFDFAQGRTHLDYASRILPDDPFIAFSSGVMHETLASARIREFARTVVLPSKLTLLESRSEREHLSQAEAHFEKALELAPAFLEARLRLGRVRGRLGRHVEAAADLRVVAESQAAPPNVQFYADLLLGDEERALGHLDVATLAYTRASTRFPRAQSVRFAASHLLHQRGEREAARAELDVFLQPRIARDDDDPWWAYHWGEGRDLDRLLEQLRAPFLRDRAP